MMTFILKMTICAALLLVVYFFLFEKEKMHRFKRFYLLFSLVFSLTIPLLTIEFSYPIPFLIEQATTQETITSVTTVQGEHTMATSQNPVNFQNILLIGCVFISGILLLRFLSNVVGLLVSIRKCEVIGQGSLKLVLVEEDIIPHSFFQYVFVNKHNYQRGVIEIEVLTHEKIHIRQRHSLDILFIEFLLILFWFNPILYLYRDRMKLNHEFLADEGVIERFENVPQYQMMLITKVAQQSNLSLTSDLNYSLTKKRLIMMTKKTSPYVAIIKRLFILPLFLVFTFAFCTKKVSDKQTLEPEENKKEMSVGKDVTESVDTTITLKTKINMRPEKTDKKAPPPPPIKIVEDVVPKELSKIVKDEDKTSPPPPPPIEIIVKDVEPESSSKIVKDENKTPPPPPPLIIVKDVEEKKEESKDGEIVDVPGIGKVTITVKDIKEEKTESNE